ncbi:threonine/homoserine efflux transporter RhtA [Rhodoglobus vestalii]|uniref:Threonine/homoserine efflux transporter RhtA n=1 Tax=Rhodoglobus vestalii TaxID=193384 RepID=A0A8H2K9L3_9MICO|nr:DMT family transporter [Rhodoglobus vestalii]TQO20642.1 threonine/homoserine efflux transporter RhtA [Rhodoglobus vestalii]
MAPSNTHTRGVYLAVTLLTAGMIMSGTIGYFVVESGAPPAVVVFWRCVIGATGLLAVISVRSSTRKELLHAVTSRVGLAIAGSGALLVLNWILIFTAYDYLSIGVSTVIFHIEPFILIALGALFLREKFNRRTLAWFGLGFLGIVLVAKPWAANGENVHSLLIGVSLTLVAATLYAASIIVVRHQQARRQAAPSPLVIITIQLIAGAIVTSPALVLSPHQVTSSGWIHLLVLGLVNTALMYLIIYAAYPRLGTATIGVLAFIYPAAAVVVDLIAYGSPITGLQILGFGAITAAGIGQILTERRSTALTLASRYNPQGMSKAVH